MPFPGGIDSLANGTLLLAAVAAFLYLLVQDRPPSWRRTAVKAAAVALLAVLAFIEGGPLLLVAALLASAAADALLAQTGGEEEGEGFFVAGLAGFLLAHLAYVALFAIAGGWLEILSVQPWRLALPALATLATLLLSARLLPAAGPALRMPVAAYGLAILAMVWLSATVPVPLVMIGAALFFVSDAILATEKFLLSPSSPHRGWTGPAVWLLYFLGQATITLGFLL